MLIYYYNITRYGAVIKEYRVTLEDDFDFASRFRGLDFEGVAIREQWELNGVVHRDEGPAVIMRHPVTMAVIMEEYYRNGKLHREPEPAQIFYDEYGNQDGVVWYRSGRRWIEGQDNWLRLHPPDYMPGEP